MTVLVSCAARGRVNKSFAIGRDIGAGAVKSLLAENSLAFQKTFFSRRNSPDVTGPQRDVPICDQKELFAVGQPGWLSVHVPGAKIEPVATKTVIFGQSNLRPCPLAVTDRTDVDVEIAVRPRRDVGELASVGEKTGSR